MAPVAAAVRRVVFAICLLSDLLIAGSALAQLPPFPPAIRTIPAAPTSDTPVTIEVDFHLCFTQGASASFTAPFVVRLNLVPGGVCPVLPPIYVPVRVPVGTLPSGTYQVNVYYGTRLLSTALFVVGAPVIVPAVSAFGLALLALAMGVAGAEYGRRSRW